MEFALINYGVPGLVQSINRKTLPTNQSTIITIGDPSSVWGSAYTQDVLDKNGADIHEIWHNHPRNTPPSCYNHTTGKIVRPIKHDAGGAVGYLHNSRGNKINRYVYAPNNQMVYPYDNNGFSQTPAAFYGF